MRLAGRTPPRLLRHGLAIAVTATLTLSACGGSDEPTLATPDTTPTTSASESPTAGTTSTGDTGDEATPVAAEPTATPEPTPTLAPGQIRPMPTQAPTDGPPAFTGSSKLSTVGLDEIFFGTALSAAAEAADTTWQGIPDGALPQCFTVQPAGPPAGIVFTVVSGYIERADISTEIITTSSGTGVGTTVDEIRELFGGQLTFNDTEDGQEIVFTPSSGGDTEFRVVWTTDGTTVTAMRAGRVPFVEPPTPCSG